MLHCVVLCYVVLCSGALCVSGFCDRLSCMTPNIISLSKQNTVFSTEMLLFLRLDHAVWPFASRRYTSCYLHGGFYVREGNITCLTPCLKLQEAFSRVLRNPPLLFCSQSSVWFSFLSFISKASFSSMSSYCQSLTVFSPPKTFSPQKACFIEKNVAEEPLRENKELKKPSEAV